VRKTQEGELELCSLFLFIFVSVRTSQIRMGS